MTLGPLHDDATIDETVAALARESGRWWNRGQQSPQEARRQSHRQAAFAQIEFATDSPLGFELPVPPATMSFLFAENTR